MRIWPELLYKKPAPSGRVILAGMRIVVRLQNFSVDLQNGTASFFFQQQQPAPAGLPQFAQVTVKVADVDEKTGAQLKLEGSKAAEIFLSEVLQELRGQHPLD